MNADARQYGSNERLNLDIARLFRDSGGDSYGFLHKEGDALQIGAMRDKSREFRDKR
jgi:hypothetical protein